MPRKSRRQFDDVVLCHLDLVYRMARTLVRDEHRAEDLVQETLLRAHRAFDRFDLREYGAKAWLMKILHNVFFTRREQAKRSPSLLEDVSFDDFAAEIERCDLVLVDAQEVDWEHFDEELKEAVESLSPDYRTVLVLWSLGDLSYKEIAQVMDCALGTVMSRLYRARQLLNTALSDYAKDRGIRPRHAKP